jgi:transcriptional regulator GlxA family with amidase domain
VTPRTVAVAHHITLRYLHKLFEPGPHGVAGMIRQRRLERCRRDLLDLAQADRPVAGIATRWGFSSAAHFSRVFREAYGLPPAEFRRTHRGTRPNRSASSSGCPGRRRR